MHLRARLAHRSHMAFRCSRPSSRIAWTFWRVASSSPSWSTRFSMRSKLVSEAPCLPCRHSSPPAPALATTAVPAARARPAMARRIVCVSFIGVPLSSGCGSLRGSTRQTLGRIPTAGRVSRLRRGGSKRMRGTRSGRRPSVVLGAPGAGVLGLLPVAAGSVPSPRARRGAGLLPRALDASLLLRRGG